MSTQEMIVSIAGIIAATILYGTMTTGKWPWEKSE